MARLQDVLGKRYLPQELLRITWIRYPWVATYLWPEQQDFNERLRDTILRVRERSPGLLRSNVGGWHSNNDLLQWDCGEIRELQFRFATVLNNVTNTVLGGMRRNYEWRMFGWANVAVKGNYQDSHNHGN